MIAMVEPQPTEADAFRRFEHESWERVAGIYAESWGELTARFAPPLLAALAVRPGVRLLDLACGTGAVTAAALARGAVPVGLDFSRSMLAEARRRHPGLRFEEGDAAALPFAAASFDVVSMGFGVMHLAWPDRAFAEARRVLRPGGRFGFTLWAGAEQCAGEQIIARAITALADPTGAPAGPPPGRFRDPEECRRALGAAGFAPSSLTFSTHTASWLLASVDGLFETERSAGVRTGALLARQTPERLAAIREAVRREVARCRTDTGYAVPMAAHVVGAVAG